jgi:hypothetical protein
MRWSRNSDGRKTDQALQRLLLLGPGSEQDHQIRALCETGRQWRESYAAIVHKQSPTRAFAWLGLQEDVPSPRRVVALWDDWMRSARAAASEADTWIEGAQPREAEQTDVDVMEERLEGACTDAVDRVRRLADDGDPSSRILLSSRYSRAITGPRCSRLAQSSWFTYAETCCPQSCRRWNWMEIWRK